ncbi:MAG: flagellar basal body P-ring formation chaperone FlgA [Phycisphaerae bacterium]|nr:flagellar basal body P-ring formation chaperone FlgA [Phycisphaerae bacterium]
MLILLPLIAPAHSGFAQVIVLMPEATVDSGQMTLGQIARIVSPVEGEAEQAGKAVVGPAPLLGKSDTLTLAALRDKLGEIGVNRAVWTLQGAAACRITRVEGAARQIEQLQERSAAMQAGLQGPVVSVPESAIPDSLAGCIRRLLETQYQTAGAKLSIQFDPADRSLLALQRPGYRFELAIRRATEHSVEVAVQVYAASADDAMAPSDTGKMPAPLTQDTGKMPVLLSQLVKSTQVRVKAELSAPVVVAVKNVNRGQVIAADDVQIASRSVGLASSACRDAAAVIGQQALRVIKPEEVVTPADLAPLALVHRNKLVTVWSRHGGMLLKTTARAMADGVYGEKVLVRNEVSREVYYGLVSGPDTVELDPTPVQETKRQGEKGVAGKEGVAPRTSFSRRTEGPRVSVKRGESEPSPVVDSGEAISEAGGSR